MTTYSQISANKQRTWALVSIFVVLVLGIGYIVGQQTGIGWFGIVPAAILSLIMTLVSYFAGDKMALSQAGAQEITRDDNPYLWRMIENLCISQGLPMPHVFIIPDESINAFATGRDPKHASVAVTVGALEKLENEELEGVLAHELSHVSNYDIRVMTLVVVLVGVVGILADLAFRIRLFGGNDREEGNSNPLILVVGLVAIILAPIIGQLIQLAVSRRREYLADASGALLTRYPEGLARALEKIAVENMPTAHPSSATAHLYISNPFGQGGWLARLFSTHPPLEERIRILRSL